MYRKTAHACTERRLNEKEIRASINAAVFLFLVLISFMFRDGVDEQGRGEDSWAPGQYHRLLANHAKFSIELLFMGPYSYGPPFSDHKSEGNLDLIGSNKYLGVQIDLKLKWRDHTTLAIGKVSRAIGCVF